MTHALVLLPGLNNTRAVFDGVLRALPARVQAMALDNPPLETVDAIAQALLPQLPGRFWLAGFSFGGYVALALLHLTVPLAALVPSAPGSEGLASSWPEEPDSLATGDGLGGDFMNVSDEK